MLQIGIEQRNFCVGDITGNAEKIMRAIEHARGSNTGSQLLVFPELALTGYPPEDLLLRDDFLDASDAALSQLMQCVQGIDVVVGAPVRDKGLLYNSAVWLRDKAVLARYDKRCLPNYGIFDEQRYFEPGRAPTVVEVGGARVSVTICEDLWEGRLDKDSIGDADIVINCSASPFHIGKVKERDEMLRKRATELDKPIVYVNLVGGQDELVFDGDSRAVNRNGETICSVAQFEEDGAVCEFEPGSGMVSGGAGRAHILDETEAVWGAIKTGVRDYFDKSGFENAVVGISGGIDSALVLSLLSEVIDKSRIYAFMLSSPYTSDMSKEDARALAENCGVHYRELSIEPLFQTALKTLGEDYENAPTDIAGQNLQSRIRGLLLMACANKNKGLLVATGNKSEMAVGYATLYGDMAGAFAPLKDVSKTRVYALAELCNRDKERIPQNIIERPPTAELSPGQLDSHSLPPYDTLDKIIELFIEGDKSAAEMTDETTDIGDADIKRVQEMVYASEYKRRQSPPGPRITQKAFGKDRRHPIVSRFRI